MKIASVVVWYNPTTLSNNNSAPCNIKTYSSFLDKVFIIDNSNTDNSKLASEIQNSEYYSCGRNLGIAAALNIGCKKALESGYDWCITMDQDSYWENGEFEKYLISIKKYLEQNSNMHNIAVSFSPRLKMPVKSLYDYFIYVIRPIYYKIKKPNEYKILDRCITSGNMIKLSVWHELSGFDERLFIDGVDFDFCFRLQEKDYKIIWIRAARMNHSIGDDKFYLFKHEHHNDFRLYYMIRNNLYLNSRFPDYIKFRLDVKFWLKNFIFQKHPIKRFKLIKKSEADAINLISSIKCGDEK